MLKPLLAEGLGILLQSLPVKGLKEIGNYL
jgi:hypothetical protein